MSLNCLMHHLYKIKMIFHYLGLPQFISGHLLMDILFASKSWQLWKKTACVLSKCYQRRRVSGLYSENATPSQEPAKPSLDVAMPFCIPTNSEFDFHSLLLQLCLGLVFSVVWILQILIALVTLSVGYFACFLIVFFSFLVEFEFFLHYD